MHRNVFGLGTLDLVLRIIFAGAMSVALVINILCMNFDDCAADVASFRIPGHAIANFEPIRHHGSPTGEQPEAATDMAALLRG